MKFSDFVENVLDVPIYCGLKQALDKVYDFYTKDSEKCLSYLKPSRGEAKSDLLILLPFLLEMYEKEARNERKADEEVSEKADN